MPEDFANEYSMHTRTCGELRSANIGEEVTLTGWVARRRDHGGLIFVDLRDRTGITQVVFDPDTAKDCFELGERMRPEWAIEITGFVRERPEDTANPDLPTGEIDVVVNECTILNESATPPFPLDDDIDTDELTRMKWRYLDMRRTPVAEALRLRDTVTWSIRNALHERLFVEVETPILGKSTPEGAPRLHRAVAHQSRSLLRASPIAAALQATYADWRHRALLPGRALLPRRGLAR